MDGVVTVADAAAGPATLDAQFEAVSQVAMADLIVISKADLVSKAEMQSFHDRLRKLNQTARIIQATQGKVPVTALFGLSGLRRDVVAAQALDWLTPAKTDPLANLSGLAPASQEPAFSSHDPRIQSVSMVFEEPLKDAAFDLWLDTLIALKGPDILRVKGIVFLEGIERPFVFHGVQHIFAPPVQLSDWPKEDRRSRIVVIARDITQLELQRSFDMLRATQMHHDTQNEPVL
jgi:G3E family GTPase